MIVDFCAYVPRQIREATAAIPDGRYVFISSVSAHVEQVRAGATEVDDVYGPPFPDTEDITWETYGPLKVACEQALRDAATAPRSCGRTTSSALRPDRPFHLLGASGLGRRTHACAAPAEQPLQWIDARDLAAFVLHVGADDVAGTFNVAVPPERHSLGELDRDLLGGRRLVGRGRLVRPGVRGGERAARLGGKRPVPADHTR